MFRLNEPSQTDIERFLAASQDLPLSYGPIGLARTGSRGFVSDEQVVSIGQGVAAFTRAREALSTWKHVQLSWLRVCPSRMSVEPGTVVAVVARHAGFWSINGCRVVYSIGGSPAQEFGFAYGSLIDHAEIGEEIFKVSMDPESREVVYTIRAVSKPRAALAWLGHPVTRSLQARFRRDSAAALITAIGG